MMLRFDIRSYLINSSAYFRLIYNQKVAAISAKMNMPFKKIFQLDKFIFSVELERFNVAEIVAHHVLKLDTISGGKSC